MNITHTYSASDPVRQLNSPEQKIGKQVLTTNLGLKSSEHLLIVTDPAMVDNEAAIWFEAGKSITDQITMVVFDGMTEDAQEPPKEIADLMLKHHVIMLQTSYSLSHTQARRTANAKGARIASLPTVTHEILMRTLNVDYSPIADLSTKVAQFLSSASSAYITAPGGTDIDIPLGNRQAIADTGLYTKPGLFGNLPAGEAFIAPLENKSDGVIVFDASINQIKLDKPIIIEIADGMAETILGGKAATDLANRLSQVGQKARNIAELGVGTNPQANPKGLLIEAEKAHGTVHLALGNNATFGGTVNVPFHSDGVILKPTLYLNDQLIIQDGEFKV